MPSSPRYDLGERLPYLINRVGAALVGMASPELHRLRITIPLWRILAVLAHRGELRQVDLAAATSIDAPTVSRLITGASRKGFVTRTRSHSNNREVTVRLTKEGRRAVDFLIPHMVADERIVFAGLSKVELARLKAYLRRMYRNIADYRRADASGSRTGKRGAVRHG